MPADRYRIGYVGSLMDEIRQLVPSDFARGSDDSQVIYGLCSTRARGQIRYVGKTPEMSFRLHQHIRGSSSSPNAVFEWIRQELLQGATPSPVCLEVVERERRQRRSTALSNVYAAEKRWIKKLASEGAELLNTMHVR